MEEQGRPWCRKTLNISPCEFVKWHLRHGTIMGFVKIPTKRQAYNAVILESYMESSVYHSHQKRLIMARLFFFLKTAYFNRSIEHVHGQRIWRSQATSFVINSFGPEKNKKIPQTILGENELPGCLFTPDPLWTQNVLGEDIPSSPKKASS